MPTITPLTGPAPVTPSTSSAGGDARSRAIAKLTAPAAPEVNQAQASPVQNPTSVTPEEMTGNTHAPEAKGQTDTTETLADAVEATKAPETADKVDPPADPLSKQFATLARKERQLQAKAREQELATRQREDALSAREAAIKAKEAEYSNGYIRKDAFKADPFSALQDAGVSYDELTEMALTNPQDNKVTQALSKMQAEYKAEIQALRDEQTKTQKSAQDAQANAYKQAVEQIRNEVKQLTSSDPEFETIHAAGATDDVVDLIEQTFKEDGVLMTVAEAAKAVEDYLVDEAVKIAKLKKIQSRLQPKQESSPAGAAPKQAVEANSHKQPQMKTLTNSLGTNRPLSAKERAVLAFKGELNKN